MTDKDKQQMEVLKLHLTDMQIRCHHQDHELMELRVHAARQDSLLNQLLNLVGLLGDDIKDPNALTVEDKSLLLRVRRALN